MENKITLRNKFKTIRKSLDMKKKSDLLCEKLKKTEFYKISKNVMIYYPLKNEVNLLSLLDDDKKFYLPKVCGEDLQICPYKKDDELNIAKFNVCEPCSSPISAKVLDLIVVPALCVDRKNYRLGYGGGFYDRFLAKNPEVKSVVLIPKELMIEDLPIEDFDQLIDEVVIF